MFRPILIIFAVVTSLCLHAQRPVVSSHNSGAASCEKGTASIIITGLDAHRDSATYRLDDNAWKNWSGDLNTRLDSGTHTVQVHIIYRHDSLRRILDTTLQIEMEKTFCRISVPKYFSPNGDNYADLLLIGNIQYYQDFELEIFNRWGQRVHHQKGEYVPWDGKWLGVDVPDGAYYFVFRYSHRNTKLIETGDISILR